MTDTSINLTYQASGCHSGYPPQPYIQHLLVSLILYSCSPRHIRHIHDTETTKTIACASVGSRLD